MTVYVDDITISGANFNKKVLFDIRGILNKRKLESHPKKEHVYLGAAPREITGSIIDGAELKLPNSKHRKIRNELNSYLEMTDGKEKLEYLEKIIGKVVAASQVEISFLTSKDSLMQEKNRLKKFLRQNKRDKKTVLVKI